MNGPTHDGSSRLLTVSFSVESLRVFLFELVAILLVLRFPIANERGLVVGMGQVDGELADAELDRIAGRGLELLHDLGVRVSNLALGAIVTDEHDLLHLTGVDEVDELGVFDFAIGRVGEVDDRHDGDDE